MTWAAGGGGCACCASQAGGGGPRLAFCMAHFFRLQRGALRAPAPAPAPHAAGESSRACQREDAARASGWSWIGGGAPTQPATRAATGRARLVCCGWWLRVSRQPGARRGAPRVLFGLHFSTTSRHRPRAARARAARRGGCSVARRRAAAAMLGSALYSIVPPARASVRPAITDTLAAPPQVHPGTSRRRRTTLPLCAAAWRPVISGLA